MFEIKLKRSAGDWTYDPRSGVFRSSQSYGYFTCNQEELDVFKASPLAKVKDHTITRQGKPQFEEDEKLVKK